MAIPYSARDSVRTLSNIYDGVFCIVIWHGPNPLELIDILLDMLFVVCFFFSKQIYTQVLTKNKK